MCDTPRLRPRALSADLRPRGGLDVDRRPALGRGALGRLRRGASGRTASAGSRGSRRVGSCGSRVSRSSHGSRSRRFGASADDAQFGDQLVSFLKFCRVRPARPRRAARRPAIRRAPARSRERRALGRRSRRSSLSCSSSEPRSSRLDGRAGATRPSSGGTISPHSPRWRRASPQPRSSRGAAVRCPPAWSRSRLVGGVLGLVLAGSVTAAAGFAAGAVALALASRRRFAPSARQLLALAAWSASVAVGVTAVRSEALNDFLQLRRHSGRRPDRRRSRRTRSARSSPTSD